MRRAARYIETERLRSRGSFRAGYALRVREALWKKWKFLYKRTSPGRLGHDLFLKLGFLRRIGWALKINAIAVGVG